MSKLVTSQLFWFWTQCQFKTNPALNNFFITQPSVHSLYKKGKVDFRKCCCFWHNEDSKLVIIYSSHTLKTAEAINLNTDFSTRELLSNCSSYSNSLPTQRIIATLKCAAKLRMKTNFSDQISYRFPRLFPSTAIFSCDISYISILSRHELFYEFLVSVKLKNNPLEMVSAHRKHLPSAQYEKDNSGPQTFGKMSLF